ncbi:MAG: PSD1 and planctomycete cytochrome C domain-containing protein [Fimbriimonas sp.]|nr:PSD1 and planctomycete cytochrome C domain-containing protein [Fimbriimonas sp.]
MTMASRTYLSRSRRLSHGLLALSVTGLVAAINLPNSPQSSTAPTKTQEDFFEARIRPVLASNCYACHGGGAHSSGLRLDSKAGLLKGGDRGPAIVLGSPDKSLLMHVVRQNTNLKMPPSGPKLSADQIADLSAWIQDGAPWPTSVTPAPRTKEVWWSFQPVRQPVVPHMGDASWVANPIDAYVLDRLRAAHMKPAPPADRRTLLRRVTYDLTGLPPNESDMESFLTDRSPNAYGKVVDRLLASPRYGERWARHWMDVARYADTKGYVFQEDRNYPNAYTYRDWLIQAFNEDLPYDKFVVAQIAADRLAKVRSSEELKSLAALGYLTLGRRFIGNVADIIDDRIDVTMRGFQGLTVGCARCHDHKFDPIPTQDYYSLYAVFNSSEESQEPISDRVVTQPWLDYQRKLRDVKTSRDNLLSSQMAGLRRKLKIPVDAQKLSVSVLQALQALREDQLPDAAALKNLEPAFDRSARESVDELGRQIVDLQSHAPPSPEFAMAMKDNVKCEDGVVFKRGNPNNRGDAAPRRFLLALSKPDVERPHWTSGSGRLELAEAIASKANPLTARVFVNRVWQDHFGAGIVRTPSDFGHQGERPTDQALLDYLAWSFMSNNWSIKRLQKLIVTSSTYCQSSDASPQTLERDPDNRLWSRMNRHRLDLEEMRDTFEAAAGLLDVSRAGGRSVDLWAAPFTPRRAVYGFIERQNLPGIFRTFDFASPDSTNAKRFATTVPQQALFFMNSSFSVTASQALGALPEIRSASSDAQCVRKLYLRLFQRLPDRVETAAALAYLGSNRNAFVPAPESVWTYGYGGYDPSAKRVVSFSRLSKFAENSYRFSDAFPDPKIGYLTLNAVGGHPGQDEAHSAIRRWTAPVDGAVSISGLLAHRQKEGDGVRARVVSSRYGLVGEWPAHNQVISTGVASVSVSKGDLLDFVLDPMSTDAYDSFQWSPVVRMLNGQGTWDAAKDFGPPSNEPTNRLALYIQALMMTNEFMFVD